MTETVFVGRRAGAVVGVWRARPTMMDVPADKRSQDKDIVFEEISGEHSDVVTFAARPMPVPRPSAIEMRLAALESDVAAAKSAQVVK